MRLTLRNLLRFLDQTSLRSVERARLEELVDESEKAEAWIKRIDSLRRSQQTRAPSIDCHDPPINRVASYLDQSMGEAATVEFEKEMLSSDELLAEVASCHEVRESMRSDSLPSIPILLRQSVYDIGRDSVACDNVYPETSRNQTPEDENVAAIAASMEDLPYVDSKPEDPQHLSSFSDDEEETDDEPVSIESLSRLAQKKSRIVMAVLIAIVAGLLGLTFWLGRQSERLSNNSAFTPGATNQGQTGDKTADVDPGKLPVELPTKTDSELNDSSDIANADAGNNESPENDQPAENDSPGEWFPLPAAADPTPEPDGETANRLPESPNIEPVRVFEPAVPPRPALEIATFISIKATMLTRDAEKGMWIRVATDAPLLEGMECLVLPGIFVELDFNGKFNVQIAGPARFSIGQRDLASDIDVIEVALGLFHVKSIAEDVELFFVRHDHRYRLTLPVSGSSATANFDYYLPPGSEPRETTSAKIEFFIATVGRATVSEADATWNLAESTAMVRSRSDQADYRLPATTGPVVLPITLRKRDYSTRLRETVGKNFRDLSDLMEPGKPLTELLVRMKNDVRQERRFASMSWLATIGNYSYLLDFLSEEKNRNNWRSVIESVRASIVANPENSIALFDCLSQTDDSQRDIMYKLLLGYTQEELAQGGDEQLVAYLLNDSLPIRVLAIEQIRLITGGRIYGFAPDKEQKDGGREFRRRWDRVLKKKELQYQTPPSLPVPEFSTVPQIEPEIDPQSQEKSDDTSGIE